MDLAAASGKNKAHLARSFDCCLLLILLKFFVLWGGLFREAWNSSIYVFIFVIKFF
jgi:hypothetical protein